MKISNLKEAEKALELVKKNFAALEKEKIDIMERFLSSSEEEKQKIQQEVNKSEKKYKLLYEKTLEISAEIKRLKNLSV